jgi:hypothetical protein
VLGSALAAAIVAVACGVPTEETPRRVGAGDVPPGLSETTTTAATTTTTVADTINPTVGPPTTVPPSTVPQQALRLVFVRGSQLETVTRSVPTPVTNGEAMAALGAGPGPGDPSGLRSVVPRDAVIGVDVVRGQATVDIRGGVLERVLPRDDVYLWGRSC